MTNRFFSPPCLQTSRSKNFYAVSLLCTCLTALAQAQFESIFDGKTLDDWEGQSDLWRIEDEAIVGTTVGKNIKTNTFLIYEGSRVRNFHLKAKLRMEGENNSGIMYRAQDLEDVSYGLKGPQMDIHPKPEYQGMYYSEQTGRGIIAQRGQEVRVSNERNDKGKVTIQVVGEIPPGTPFNLSEWNEYEVIAVGRRSIHLINGVVTVDVTDQDETTELNGKIGLQLHQGPDMTIRVKDVKIRHLRGQDARKALEENPTFRLKKKLKN